MTYRTFATAVGAVAALAFASQALAQAKPAAPAPAAAPRAAAAVPAQPQVNHGPAIAGVCLYSQDMAVSQSMVGKAVGTRLQTLLQQAQAELNAEKTGLDNDVKTFSTQRASLDAGTAESRAAAIQVRGNNFQRKAQLRDRELQATEQKAVSRVLQELTPVILAVYQQKGCSILLSREAAPLANPAMDITPQLIAGLNAKIQTINFDRERLDTPAATPAK